MEDMLHMERWKKVIADLHSFNWMEKYFRHLSGLFKLFLLVITF